MKIKKLNEEFERLLKEEHIYEMTIPFGQDLASNRELPVKAAIEKVLENRKGHVKVNKSIKIRKIVTDMEIKHKLSKPELKNYEVTIDFPFYIVWGEPTINGKEGNGIIHILQEHKDEFNSLKEILQQCISKGKVATYDEKHDNWIFEQGKYRFVFSLTTDNGGWDAIWNTGFDKTKKENKK